jgi:hypothetical protein
MEWLDKNDLQLIWLVGGEKYLPSKRNFGTDKKLIYSGMYKLSSSGVTGDTWFVEENRKGRKPQ